MKIVYLAAGAAGMYCGSCLHDNTLAAALLEAGHDVLLVPTYTPLRTDEPDVSQRRLFFGGINVYLQQKSVLFRHTPWFVDKALDSPALIKLATRGGPSVEAEKLGDLTVSMLAGRHGRQRKELTKLVHWLRTDIRPDIVHLSNSMFVGMAQPLRELSIPVVCTLSGEDLFLEKLPPPHYEQARELLRQQARHISGFVALNGYYASFMAEYLDVPREKIEVIPHGLRLEGHGLREIPPGEPLNIGFLARICPEKGLHLLVEAFEHLMADRDLPPLKLRVAGYLGPTDRAYFSQILERTARWKPQTFEHLGEVDRPGKIAFLQSLYALALPTVYPESKGLPVLEAWANGIPVVLPEHGTFPELVADTGGGLLHAPADARALAATLRGLILDTRQADVLGQAGRQAVHARYHAGAMAARTEAWYHRVGGHGMGEVPNLPR